MPGIRGVLKYSGITPLKYDIMGPFSVLPMQCSHGLVSMCHAANGWLEVDGKEYRFATYLGVRIISDNDRIILTQGKMRLEIVCYPICDGKELSAPQRGRISESIRESCDAYLKLTLTESGKILAELESRYATYKKRQ